MSVFARWLNYFSTLLSRSSSVASRSSPPTLSPMPSARSSVLVHARRRCVRRRAHVAQATRHGGSRDPTTPRGWPRHRKRFRGTDLRCQRAADIRQRGERSPRRHAGVGPGSPSEGRPAGTSPVMGTPNRESPNAEAAAIDSATTASPTGLAGKSRSPSTSSRIAITPSASALICHRLATDAIRQYVSRTKFLPFSVDRSSYLPLPDRFGSLTLVCRTFL